MTLPLRLTFYDASYRLDGGTTTLYATDEQGAEHHVLLPRSMFSDPDPTARQLRFDSEPVPVRSFLESNLLRLCKEAQLAPRSIPSLGVSAFTPPFAVAGDDLERLSRGGPDENLRWLVQSVIDYVESDAYGYWGASPNV